MFTRAVILPATPLLVPGAAGAADPLRQVRLAACAALAVLAESGPPLILATRPGRTRGPSRARPSLAAAGIADHMLADDVVAPWAGHTSRPVAGTAASTLLLCASSALGGRAADIFVLELPAATPGGAGAGRADATGVPATPLPTSADVAPVTCATSITAHLEAGGTLLIASGRPPGGTPAPHSADSGAVPTWPSATGPAERDALAPALAEALAATEVATWTPDTRVLRQEDDHLPPEYHLTTLAAPGGVA